MAWAYLSSFIKSAKSDFIMFLICICFENFSNSRKQRKTCLITCCKISLWNLNLSSFGSILAMKKLSCTFWHQATFSQMIPRLWHLTYEPWVSLASWALECLNSLNTLYYRGSPDSTNFGFQDNRAIGEIVLIGDWFSTKTCEIDKLEFQSALFHIIL